MRRFLLSILFTVVASQAWSVKVGVLLPFKDPAVGTAMIQFYRGFLLAVDSVKHEGQSVEVYAFDAGKTEESLYQVLEMGELATVDIMIGPGVGEQTTLLSSYCAQHGIRLVMPFATHCVDLAANPWVTQVFVDQDVATTQAIQLVIENLADSRFVIWKSTEPDTRSKAFQTGICERLMADNLSVSTISDSTDVITMEACLNKFRRNVIVPDAGSEKNLQCMLQSFQDFQSLHPDYSVSFLGHPQWLELTYKYDSLLHVFDTYVYTPYFIDRNSEKVKNVSDYYRQTFRVPMRMAYPSIVLLGLDLGYFFLHGSNEAPYQQFFDFRPVSDFGGMINKQMQLVNFKPDNSIQQIR